ncbi:hypothetical protein Tco_0717051 [Tanacetum coccineum]
MPMNILGLSTAGGINQVPSTPCAHDIAYSFLAQPTTSPQLKNEDFQQIDGDDLEELDLRWQVAMLTVRVNKSNAPTNESSSHALVAKDGLGGYDWSNDFEVEPVNYALMAIYSSSSSSSSDSRRSSDDEHIPENDIFSKNGYKAVPPPITGNFLTPRADISFAGLDEYAIRNKIIKSHTTEINNKTGETAGKTNDAITEKPKSVSESVVSNPKINRDSVIIKDWTSDDEEEVSGVKKVRLDTRDDKSGQNSHKQGVGFRKVKACFVCKSTNHLIKAYWTDVRPRGSCSPIKRSYYTKPAFRPKDLKQDVKTFGVKNMTTAGRRAVVNIGKVDHSCAKKDEFLYGNPKKLTMKNTMEALLAFGSDPKEVAQEKPFENSSPNKDIQDLEDAADKEEQHQMQDNEKDLQDELEMLVTQELVAKAMDDVSRQAFEEEKRRIASQKKAAQATSTNQLSTDRLFVSTDRSNTPNVSAASTSTGANADESSFVYLGGNIPIDASTLPNVDLPIDPNMPALEDASDTHFSNMKNN